MSCNRDCANCQDILVVGALPQTAGDVFTPSSPAPAEFGDEDAYEAWLAEQAAQGEETDANAPKPTQGWPAPAVPRAELWYVTESGARYMLSPDFTDTLSGLAKTYLGAYSRWREIYALNPNPRGPAGYFAGDLLKMPKEAIANAIRRGFLPDGTEGVHAGDYGSGAELAPEAKEERSRIWKAVGIAAASAAAGAATTVAVTKAIG